MNIEEVTVINIEQNIKNNKRPQISNDADKKMKR